MYLCFCMYIDLLHGKLTKKINCVVVNVDSSPKKIASIKGQIFYQLQNGLKLPAAKHCTRLSGRRVNLVESPTYRESDKYKSESRNNSATEGQTDCWLERVARTDGIEVDR